MMLRAPLKLFFMPAIAFLIGTAGLSQQAKQYSFRHFSVTTGLASNSVNDVLQDKDGYIWLATTNGLQRYDGNSFLTFKARPGDPWSIPNTDIANLYRDRKDKLWITYDNNNFGVFDTKRFAYHKADIAWDNANIALTQHFVELQTGELLLIKRDRAIFRGMRKLPAGHYLKLQDGKVEITRYWQFPAVQPTRRSERASAPWPT